MPGIRQLAFFCMTFFFAIAIAVAEGDNKDQKKHDQGAEDKLSTTEGEISIDGQPLKYKATAGHLILKDDMGKPKAQMFFVAYQKKDVCDPSMRPITFVFNGGPGAAAVWLHLGTAGPRRIAFDDDGNPPTPPYRLEDNPNTWLVATDLVFIDPVGTGFSRARAVLRRRGRHSHRRRVHPPLYHAVRALAVTQVPGRRKLRHHAGRRVVRASARPPGNRAQRHRADLVGAEFPHAFHQRRK